MSDPLTMHEVSAELRHKAARLRPEMNPPHDPSSHDGRGFKVSWMLTIALLDAVKDEYNAAWRDSPDESARAAYERAVRLCREKGQFQDHQSSHGETWLGIDTITNGNPQQIPIVATAPKRRTPEGVTEDGQVSATQLNLYDLKPLWAQFLWEAIDQLYDEREAARAAQEAA